MSLNDQFNQMRTEWTANRRLRVGVAAIALILLLAALQWLDAWREARQQSAAVAMREATDLILVASQREWTGRARKASDAEKELRGRFWLVASDGAAQAAVRDLLQANAKAVGLPVQRVTVRNVAPGREQTYAAVRAEIQGDYQPLVWQRFVSSIEAHQPSLIIESERIDRTNPQRARYRLNVTAWYRLEASGENK
ncbi:MAG TPA: hypothetical protein DCQ80_09555 [Pseudomonas sp.]|nr:hypothetical protein [Pseudomonas sp.]